MGCRERFRRGVGQRGYGVGKRQRTTGHYALGQSIGKFGIRRSCGIRFGGTARGRTLISGRLLFGIGSAASSAARGCGGRGDAAQRLAENTDCIVLFDL